MTTPDVTKIKDDGRYIVVDGFSEEVERTDDLDYAKGRAETNGGWVADDHRSGDIIWDSEDHLGD